MAKNYSNRNRKRKALIAMLCALSVTCTGLAAACAPDEEGGDTSTAVTAKEDAQLLKNGNFEHYDIPDKAIHLIKNVNSWTLSGDNSVKSGVIGTSKDDWDKLTDDELSEKLNYNNDLSSGSEDYVNYNSMRSRDILYKDTYAAMLEADNINGSWIEKLDGGYEEYFGITGSGTESDPYKYNGEEVYKETLTDSNKKEYVEFYYKKDDTPIRKTLIKNPETHWGTFTEENGEYKFGGKKAYKDENGKYYFNEDLETDPVGNVLMIHNAGTDTSNNGIQQYYTSNTISLEAHTSAEISLWVKTSDLRFDKGYFATAEQEDKGAYIEVVQTVAGTTIDAFQIKAINTQNIIDSATKAGTTLSGESVSNGWIKYTVYVNACDFASTTVQLKLGLGGSEQNEKVTGYAFFDDVQVKRYRDLSKDDSYSDAKVENTTCTLTSDEEEKIFYTDVTTKNADKAGKLHTYDFNYLIDLASEQGMKDNYSPINFGSNVEVGLTTETDSKGVKYAAATEIKATVDGVGKNQTQTDLKLPKDVKARPTDQDIIKVLKSTDKFSGASTLLNSLVEKGAPELLGENESGNTLVMFSAWGAPYTATISDNAKFELAKDKYLLVSFWVKTSDMDGGTAATAKIYELNDKGVIDEDSVQSLTIDTTDKTTDFEKEKDIYNGWVQCFFFVKNDTDANKTFNIDFSFGTTAITTATSFESGYAAIANLQTLPINEDIYNLATAGDTTALFSFSTASEKDGGTAFAEATGVYDVTEGIALPSSYTGVNGGNVITVNDKDAPLSAGLVNKDAFDDKNTEMTADEKTAILSSFMAGATNWETAFGKDCYQPLIIINTLRDYAVKAEANSQTYKDYHVYKDGKYEKVASDAEYDEKETYYSLNKVVNYGFIGDSKTVSANGREVISVRVKVTGKAEAYIYLVNSDNTDEVLNFTTPSYTFWYDEEGNVLDEELNEDWKPAQHREHIVYTLREDGLYEDKDGKLFANLNNLVKSYKDSQYEHDEFYDANGNKVSYDDLKDGETYYSDKEHTKLANHYLCATDGTHVYEYIDGHHYYVEITKNDNKTTETTNTAKEVNNFNAEYARYSNPDIDKQLFVKVTAEDCNPALENSLCDNYGWVTVNFVISAGSEEKGYRLALWSGDRTQTGVTKNGENYEYAEGAVAFDYFHGTVSEDRLAAYEAEIINAYNSAIIEVQDNVNKNITDEKDKVNLFKDLASGTKANIASYEKLVAGLDKEYSDQIYAKLAAKGYVESVDGKYVTTYTANYYTYTLYDSEAYVPFNATTAGDGETGYNYDASSFEETLAYFAFDDDAHNQRNVFVDYSAVDQSITKNTVDSGDDSKDEDTKNNSAELGLYISSIVLVVVLLITLVSILVTQYVKKLRKHRGAKNSNKNVYRKRDRYVKKLHLVKDEMVEPENVESDLGEVPAEEVTPVEDEVTEIPAEETTETTETEETTPAEEVTETTETVEPEAPDGEDKE